MTFTEYDLLQRERKDLPEYLPYIFPDSANLNTERDQFQFDPHGHIIAVVSLVAAAFPDTDSAFHSTLLSRLQLPYLDASTVRAQLVRSIGELKEDASKTRFVEAMEYVLNRMHEPSPNG